MGINVNQVQELAVYSALSRAENNKSQVESIKAGLRDNYSFENLIAVSIMINKDNVLKIVADEESLDNIVDSYSDVRIQCGKQIIESLLELADEKQVDVSNIVFKDEKGNYCVGRDVKDGDDDVEYGSDALDSKSNLRAVIRELKAAIDNAKDIAAGNGSDVGALLTMLEKRIDADTSNGGNNSGYIDVAEEITAFKQAVFAHGYDIRTVLEQIRDSESAGVGNSTELQNIVANIFAPEQKAAHQKAEADKAKDSVKALAVSFKNHFCDKEFYKESVPMLNSENIREVLNENPYLISNISLSMSHCYEDIEDIRERGADYTTPVLNAVVECAQQNGINIEDLVLVNSDKYIVVSNLPRVSAGSDATDVCFGDARRVVEAI